MSFDVEESETFSNLNQLDLDTFLNNDETRKPNNVGLYRVNCLCVGKTGSGKTTWLIKALLTNAIDEFKKIIILIPRESMNSGIYAKLAENQQLKNHFAFVIIGEERLPTIEEFQQASKQIKGRIAIIIDDFINSFTKIDWLMLKRYITQLSRIKYGASLFVLTQYLQLLPVSYRKNFNMFVIFTNSFSKLQFNDLFRSYYDCQVLTKEQLENLYNTTKQSKHEPLILINNGDSEHSMLFCGNWLIA